MNWYRRNTHIFVIELLFLVIFIACTKDGDVVYEFDPTDHASTQPLVTVIYDPGALGDLAYNDLICEGVERAASRNGLRVRQFSPRNRDDGLTILSGVINQMSNATDTTYRNPKKRILFKIDWENE